MSNISLESNRIKDLISISAGMLRLKSVEDVCQLTAESVVEHTLFKRSVVSILEPDGTFKRYGFGGLSAEEMATMKTIEKSTLDGMQEYLVDRFRVGRSYYIPKADAKLEGLSSQRIVESGINGNLWDPDDFLFIPLYNPDNRIIGLISTDDPEDHKRPTPETLLPMELFATQIAAVLENLKNVEKQREMIQQLKAQQQVVLELSTPVMQVWDKVLALPLIGGVDSARAQQIMENVLVKISETGSNVLIIDITGVPVIDTLVASHLIKTVSAARLLGAQTIISGINPEVAQTLVHLGVDLSTITTKSNLARGISTALKATGKRIVDVDQ